MTRNILLLTLFCLCAYLSRADQMSGHSDQISDQTLGIHGGNGWELSWQKGNNHKRCEVNFGTLHHGLSISLLKQFLYPLGTPSLRTYVGYGGQTIFDSDTHSIRLALGLAANFGLEYSIRQIPLNISLDWRPVLAGKFTWIKDGADKFGIWNDGLVGFIGIGLRYRF